MLTHLPRVGVNQPVRWFLGGKGLGIEQGTSAWVSSFNSLPRGYRTREEKVENIDYY